MKQINFNQHRTLFNYFLIIVIGIFVGIQVFVSNKIATSGKLLSQLEQEAVSLEDENRKLLAENVELLSLNNLYNKAKELGFTQETRVLNLTQINDNLASR